MIDVWDSPVLGANAPDRLLDPKAPANELISRFA
jgi:hypothetical protein